MPDIYMDVDAALVEVPINLLPLIDDTDKKTIEDAVTYDQAGLALIWNFVTTAGAQTATSVTPTAAGDYDWTDQGTNGLYSIEIPASGGASANNNTEGFGWFTGVATGILPWRGPVICFRAAGLNNMLIDSAYSATRGLAGTALPDAVADAAGGLPKSDAGGLDIDAKLANTNEVTAARMGALTDWINGGRLDLLLDAIKAVTDVIPDAGALTTIGTDTARLTAVRAAVLTDWINGGRLDLLLDAIPTTAMRGTDSAALASICTETRLAELDAANLPSDVDDILTDTGTTLETHLTDIKGGTFAGATDSLEAIRDRGDAEWTTGAGGPDRLLMVDTTIATLASQTSFTLAGGSTDDNAYRNCTVVIEDVSTAAQKAIGVCSAYAGATKTVTLKYDPAVFTMATTDKVYILAENALKSTDVNRQLDVTAAGKVNGVVLVDTTTTNSDMVTEPPTAAAVVNEWETQSQADPTGFHVNVKEVNGTGQTANDNGADINLILGDSNELQTNQGNWLTATSVTVSDKTGFSLSAAGVQAIWDALTSALTTVGSIGKKLADWTVGTIDTYTGNTKQTADHAAGIADIPTVAEFEARSLVSADYVVVGDTIAGVTLVDTVTTNSDLVPAAAIKTAMEAAGSDLDYLIKALVNKLIITEADGNTEMFNDASSTLGSVVAAFTTDGTHTTRKRMVK